MSFLEHGEGTSPQMGGWYLPHFFLIQNIKFGRSKDAPSMEYIWSIHRGHLQGGGWREKCISDRVIDGASTECQSVHGAYYVHVVRTKPKPNLHPNPHLLT